MIGYRRYIGPVLFEMNDSVIQSHSLILAEIGTYDQSRSVISMGAVHNNHLVRIVFVVLFHIIDDRSNDSVINLCSMTLRGDLQIDDLV